MGNTPLLLACVNGNEEIAKYLLEKGSDGNQKNIKGMTCLHLSCVKGEYDLVKLLIEHKANIYIRDAEHMYPFHYAIKNDKVEILDYLQKFAGFEFHNADNAVPL